MLRRQVEATTSIVKLDPANYTVAWIAPLEIEAQAAHCLLDEQHHGRFPVSRGDDYVFQAGSMCGHNIIIATLPAGQEYGTGSAAALASQVKKFFPNLWFGLLVGVAAGLPDLSRVPPRDIRLGDVLVGLHDGEGAGLIAYDLGKELEDGFHLLQSEHGLAPTEPIVRSAIGRIKREAPNDTKMFLPHYETARSQKHSNGTFSDPGQDRDILYLDQSNGSEEVAQRDPRPVTERTRVWYGLIGSGDKLLRNVSKRNELRDKYDIIGLEMEAAGVMNRIPVGIIRGVCDYGDRHKNKEWQPYAAAMAASYAKAVLAQIPPSEPTPIADPDRQSCYHIQLAKNLRFTGRTAIIDTLEERFFITEESRKMALVGLGGAGKTQIALHFAYRVKEIRPDYSIFWVPVLSDESVEQAYVAIAKKLGLKSMNEDGDKVSERVCQYLSSDEAGKWLLVVDNADDQDLVFGSADRPGIEEYLPESDNGLILLTTRSRHIAVDFAQSDVIDVEQMGHEEAESLLAESLSHSRKHLLHEKALVSELLDRLTFLPLAITQAAAYLNQTMAPLRSYLTLLQVAENNMAGVLDREFRDKTRYRGSRNAVGTTWLVSFDQIKQLSPFAIDLLSFMSCVEPKAIPSSMLPKASPEEFDWAIGTLCGYSFMIRRGDSDIFDMHSLVHGAARSWLEKEGRKEQVVNNAIGHLVQIFPSDDTENPDSWRELLPHAMRLLYQRDEQEIEDAFRLFEAVGQCFLYERRFKEASRCFEKVLSWRRKTSTEIDDRLLEAELMLGITYLNDRRSSDAIKILEHVASEVEKKRLDETDPDRLTLEHALASAYLYGGRPNEAIEILEHIVAIDKVTLEQKDPNRIESLYNLANAYIGASRVDDGIEILESVVQIRGETLDAKDLRRVHSEYQLARAYLEKARVNDAIDILESVVKIEKEILDEKDFSRLAAEQALARAYLDNSQINDAIDILEPMSQAWTGVLDEKDPFLLAVNHELARAYLSSSRVDDAINLLEHVVKIRRETLDEKDSNRLASEHELGRAYLDNSRADDAIELLQHVVRIGREIYDEKDNNQLLSEDALAIAYLDSSRFEDAIETLKPIVKIRRETLDEKDDVRLTVEHALARAYSYSSRVDWADDAIEILEHVVKIRRETLDEKDDQRLGSEYILAKAYLARDDAHMAITLLEHVVSVESTILPEDDESRLLTIELLAKARQQLSHSQRTPASEAFPDDDLDRLMPDDLLSEAYEELSISQTTSERDQGFGHHYDKHE